MSPITPAATFAQPVPPSSSSFAPELSTSPLTTPQYPSQNETSFQPTFATAQSPPRNVLPAIPPTIPIDERDNIDHIALSAAIYALQIQREKAAKDIRLLQKIKAQAMAEPEAWLEQHAMGQDRRKRSKRDVLGATFEDADEEMEGLVRNRLQGEVSQKPEVQDTGEEDDEEEPEDQEQEPGSDDAAMAEHNFDAHDEDDAPEDTAARSAKDPPSSSTELPHHQTTFHKLPSRQNIARMPAINWAKYHVVGHALDRLHEEQRRHPTAGEPATTLSLAQGQQRQQAFQVVAPYDPLRDVVGGARVVQGQGRGQAGQGAQAVHPMATRRSSTRNG